MAREITARPFTEDELTKIINHDLNLDHSAHHKTVCDGSGSSFYANDEFGYVSVDEYGIVKFCDTIDEAIQWMLWK